jgi:signal transduction histidine kinase
MRVGRSPFGLRGRIVGALLLTTIATLVVAAVALLAPLERQLREAEQKTLLGYMLDAQSSFQQLTSADLRWDPTGVPSENALGARLLVNELAKRTGAQVNLLSYPNVLVATSDLAGSIGERFDDVLTAFDRAGGRHPRPVPTFGILGGGEVAREAMPITIGGHAYVLAARRTIDEIPRAVTLITRAFITAALAGLTLTLILGIPLAATLVRRLRRLRHAAFRLAEGGPAIALPEDRARDEVGDLTRTFSRMQLRLQQQEDVRRAFLATASHELRTPLASLRGMLEMLEEDLGDELVDIEDARHQVQRASVQSRRLGRLAADLLDLSRLDAQVALLSEPVELAELARAVVAEFELGAAALGITLQIFEAGEPVWALGDPGSIARILRILIDNAMRVSATASEIRIRMHGGERRVELTVSDDGPGVPSDEQERIFARFQRGSTTGGEPGFGLGLAIGRELAQRMGGQLLLAAGAGAGAAFTLRLSVAPAPDRDPASVQLR